MKDVPLFLLDFRKIVDNLKFNTTEGINIHPVTFYEEKDVIFFHKPIGGVMYYTVLDKTQLPKSVDIELLKGELKAWEIPNKLIKELTLKIVANES